MNKPLSRKTRFLIYLSLIIGFSLIISSIFFQQKEIYASCSVSCYPSASSCSLQNSPCGESQAGCASGRYEPPGKAYCCPFQVTCTCTPGACTGCTPVCASGQTTAVTGPLCVSGAVSSCTGSNGCTACTLTGSACYYLETNVTPSIPASISMIVEGTTYQLSINPLTPTRIKLPAVSSSNVQVSVPTFTAPPTSRGGGYYFQTNNYGVGDEWKTWTTCSGIAGEDFCSTVPNTNNTQNFVPTTKTVNQVLKEGATGKISGMYTTTDKCNNTYKYSLPVEGYYVVDTLPETQPIVIPPDITVNGCVSSTYTGSEINNPLHIEATTSDVNSNDEIQAFVLWLSKDSSVPTSTTITASYTGSTDADLGIMIRKNGSDWSNPSIYATNVALTWGPVTNGYVQINGENVIRIYDVSVTQTTNTLFDYKLEFLSNSSNMYGMYNVFGQSIDSYMINSNILDQSYISDLFNWGIDLTNPTVDNVTQQVQDPSNTELTWSTTDSTSGMLRTVMNGYRTGGTETDIAQLFLPATYTVNKGDLTLGALPLASEIGLFNDSNAWIFDNNTGETDILNIGTNEGGQIDIYVTAYDNACNTNSISEEIDLNPWFATRGGNVYSQNNISTTAKDVSDVTALDGVFNINTLMDKDHIDLGTELLATRNTSISTLIHSNLGAVQGALLYDSNNVKGYWFDILMSKFSQNIESSTSFENITTSIATDCPEGTSCYKYSEEDIAIPSGYVCDKPTLFVSKQNIYIEPNITSDLDTLSGCIFLAGNNIEILDGAHLSNGSVIEYDYIEGYMIAENQIIFPLVDEGESLRDGVEIFGGALALGLDPATGESAFSIKRNLRLFSQINPAVVLTYDNKYSNISTIFFGVEAPIYRQEVGFKSF